MRENKKDIYEGEGTVENIPTEDFFINQNNNIDSFGKCPGCEEDTLNLDTRICKCGYRLDHNIPLVINKTKNDSIKTLNYRICTCGNKMGIKSIMCKECYGRNKINGNI